MTDAAIAEPRIRTDAARPLRLTKYAIEQAKRRFNVSTETALAKRLGMTRMDFYRLKTGAHDMALSRAVAVANRIGLSIERTFEQVDHG